MKIGVGSKVVCIDSDFSNTSDRGLDARIQLFDELPNKGVTYTIRELIVYSNNKVGITLDEIKNKILPNTNIEANFNIERFAPLEKAPPKEEVIEEKQTVEELI